MEVTNIKKSFGSFEVLKGISFSLQKGEVLSIIGSSGSGKTTLLRCLNFLETANDGIIKVNEETLFDAANPKENLKNVREKRLHFGLVFQNFNLFPHMNILKNIMIASELLTKEQLKEDYKQIKLNNQEKSSKEISALKKAVKDEKLGKLKDRCMGLLERVGLESKAASYPCQLSGGQCQRAAIARALALSPDILCFDEPTSALDPELTGEVLKVIKGLKSKDSTMIVVTHEMEFARNVSDKIIFMANGVIEEIGTPEGIFDNPKSEKLKNFLKKSMEEI